MKPKKLFVCVRSDLTTAQKAVQACHAVAEFCLKFPETVLDWHESNYLVILEVENEKQLQYLCDFAYFSAFDYSWFKEPDLNNSMTAIVLEPGAEKLVRDIGLAFQNGSDI